MRSFGSSVATGSCYFLQNFQMAFQLVNSVSSSACVVFMSWRCDGFAKLSYFLFQLAHSHFSVYFVVFLEGLIEGGYLVYGHRIRLVKHRIFFGKEKFSLLTFLLFG